MNIELILFLIMLVALIIGFLFSGLNRLRKINEEQFVKKTEMSMMLKKGDIYSLDRYRKIYVILSEFTVLFLVILFVISYVILDGALRDISTEQMNQITIVLNGIMVLLFLRLVLLDIMKEYAITRSEKEHKTSINITRVILLCVFITILLYKLIMM